MSNLKRLTTAEMAQFAARGFLRFDAVVPETLNQEFLARFTERNILRPEKDILDIFN